MISESSSKLMFFRFIFRQIESGDFSRPVISTSKPASVSVPVSSETIRSIRSVSCFRS